MEKSNHKEKNETKEAESMKKGLRAETLFRYIEKKEMEFKQKRHSLLKSIVVKQRQKIAYESERWEKKLKDREVKCPKVFERKKLETAPDVDIESRSNDTIASKMDDESAFSYSLKSSLRGSRNLSGLSSLIGSKSHLFDQTSRNIKPELMAIRTIPILAELQEQREPHVNLSTNAVVDNPAVSSSKAKKIPAKKVQKAVEESEAVSKVFKSYDAFLEFQTKYSKPVEEPEQVDPEGDDEKQPIKSRMVQIRQLHNAAIKNRERIALYMSGDSNYVMGVPIGFKVDPHSITDRIDPPSENFEEVEEKVNLTEELNRPSLLGKRTSFSIVKGHAGSAPENETQDSTKKAFSLAQSQFEKGRRPTIYQNRGSMVHDADSSINDILEHLAKNVENDEKSSYKTAQVFSEEEDIMKSLAVMADDRLGLSSNFLQKSLARSDSLIKRPSELNASKSFLKQKYVNIPEKENGFASFLEEDQEFFQFSSNSGTTKASSNQQLAVKLNPTKNWEHINLKSVEEFGSTIETSKAKLDDALKRIPNSFNQLCLNIEKDNSRPKLGVFAASISSKNNTETIQSENCKMKIPKAVKYWKTSSSFDDDILTFS